MRQVTTATPARLDFRTAEAADEGYADTMSTEARAVLRSAYPEFKSTKRVATCKRREFWHVAGDLDLSPDAKLAIRNSIRKASSYLVALKNAC